MEQPQGGSVQLTSPSPHLSKPKGEDRLVVLTGQLNAG